MFDFLPAIIAQPLQMALDPLPWLAGFAATFTILSMMKSQACNPEIVWWRNKGLLTDLAYCFFLPLIMPYLRIFLVLFFVVALYGTVTGEAVTSFMNEGRGPLSGLPYWAQVIIHLLGVDFIMYWAHRAFHLPGFWYFHAVHHSPEELDWTSSYRFHPVNALMSGPFAILVMIALGIPPSVAVFVAPFDAITGALVHANLNWRLGLFRFVFAGPVFHRWHHGPVGKGGDANFGSTFTLWDQMFGTYYLPEGELPEEYGQDDPDFPRSFLGQMIYPFKKLILDARAKQAAAKKET